MTNTDWIGRGFRFEFTREQQPDCVWVCFARSPDNPAILRLAPTIPADRLQVEGLKPDGSECAAKLVDQDGAERWLVGGIEVRLHEVDLDDPGVITAAGIFNITDESAPVETEGFPNAEPSPAYDDFIDRLSLLAMGLPNGFMRTYKRRIIRRSKTAKLPRSTRRRNLPDSTGGMKLLAEDLLVAVFTGAPDKATWLEDVAAEALFDVTPSANVDPDAARLQLARILDGLPALRESLSSRVKARRAALLDAHKRVREATKGGPLGRSLGGLGVRVHEPVDLLGVYVFLPDAGAKPAAPGEA